MSYRPMVKVGNEWAGNGLRFATAKEAENSALDLMSRWMLVMDTRVDESEDPVNYRWDPQTGLVGLEETKNVSANLLLSLPEHRVRTLRAMLNYVRKGAEVVPTLSGANVTELGLKLLYEEAGDLIKIIDEALPADDEEVLPP